MENYSYGSYPDSGDSSPRSREIEFENPPPWEDQPHHLSQNYKAKFMCSYGGKILPRPHDNHLSYVGGETKILAVDRSINFPAMIAKLSALYCGDDVSFKYQLPGEDLDALISVTNDDDLDHMMHEYDRMYRTTAKSARMRLFLFPAAVNLRGSYGSDGSRPDPEQFVEALNSAPMMGPDHVINPPVVTNKAEFLFGLDKVVAPPPPPPHPPPPLQLPATFPAVLPVVSKAVNLTDAVVGGYAGDYYGPKVAPEKLPASLATVPPPLVSVPLGYWPDKQVSSVGFPTPVASLSSALEPPVYVLPASAGGAAVFHPPVVLPVTCAAAPVYGPQPQRSAPEVYREPPLYNVLPPQQLPLSASPLSVAPPPITTVPPLNIPSLSAAPANINFNTPPLSAAPPNFPPQVAKIAATGAMYPEGLGVVRHIGGFGAATGTASYAPMAYDSAMSRQVYYTGPGGVVVAATVPPPALMLPQTFPPLAAAVAVVPDRRPSGGMALEGKVVIGKVSQTSV
ncbi:hypothetical protein L484_010439 [Morus notabilis]|uniref:PB1 domain-containing protein n=1 Tax=Morus notabilis TaxID=981085 RepID=W9R1L0_9ROSA|nr:proline-rich protein 36 [Morus notabilis]EXB51459.1 hypothetical protein L484_010439 [Morus notabilis]